MYEISELILWNIYDLMTTNELSKQYSVKSIHETKNIIESNIKMIDNLIIDTNTNNKIITNLFGYKMIKFINDNFYLQNILI